MSEFKFACPVCAQHIKVESWRSNSMMECPSCFQRIIVPQAPADDVQLIIKGSKATRRLVTKPEVDSKQPPAPPVPPKEFQLPGIALAILVCALVVLAFVFRGKIFKPTATVPIPNNPVAAEPGKNIQPQPPPTSPPQTIVGTVSVVFGKGNTAVLGSQIDETQLNDQQKAFLSAIKANFANPSDFEIRPLSGDPASAANGEIRYRKLFQGGLILGVTLQQLLPNHDYVLSLTAMPGHAGHSFLPDKWTDGSRLYDFNRVTTDAAGNYSGTFCIMLPQGNYDLYFFVKDTSGWKIALQYGTFQFAVE